MKKTLLLMIAVMSAVMALSACQKKEEVVVETTEAETFELPSEIAIEIETEPETEKETEPVSESEKREVVDGKIRSFLTGEMVPAEQGLRRPIAIMMSNDKEASPQYGMNRAGVIYEAPVEANMNRFMSVIEDYDDLERIGSVRSCRTYYTYFAREWDAIYAHFGQSTFALPYLNNVDNINGLEGIGSVAYYRSSDRKAPHNAYSSGKRLNESIEKLKYRTEYDEEYENQNGHFKFSKDEVEFDKDLSLEAYKIYPGYPYNKPWFEYNEEDGLYHRFQYGKVHNGDEGPLAVKNVIFQYCPTATYADTQYLNINLHGDGYGFVFINGRCKPFKSVKDSEFGVTKYYDMDGNEIELNKGKTWICIIQTSRFTDTEIYDSNGTKTN